MAGAGYRLYTAGQVLTAAQVNTYLMEQSVMVFATSAARDAALTSIKSEGNVTFQLDNNDLDIYNGSSFSTLIGNAHGALLSWTPAVTQSGAVTVTNNLSWYQRVGRLITGQWLVTVTGSGTAANKITVTMPVTAVGLTDLCGTAYIFDTSAGVNYPSLLVADSTTAFKMYTTIANQTTANETQGSGSASTMTAGLAVGDTISGLFSYQSAADA